MLNRFFFGPIDGRPILYSRLAFTLLFLISFAFGRPGAWIGVPLALFFAWGKYPRLASVMLFIFIRQAGLGSTNTFAIYQGTHTLMFYLFYTFWVGEAKHPSTWAVRLMQMQIIFVYGCCVTNRLYSSADWRDGSALYYILLNPAWTPWHWPAFFYQDWFHRPLTWYSLFAEGALPLLSYKANLRNAVVFLLVTFHLGMAICMPAIALFTSAMIPGVLLFLCKPIEKEEIAQANCIEEWRLAA